MRLKLISLLLAVLGFAGAYLIWKLSFEIYPPMASDGAYYPYEVLKPCLSERLLSLFGDQNAMINWQSCAQSLQHYDLLDSLNFRLTAFLWVLGFGLVSFLTFALCVRWGRSRFRILRGPRLYKGREALRKLGKACRKECRRFRTGLALLPSVSLSRDRETLHHLIWGSVGGGKTQTMLRYILEAYRRGDGLLVLDTKGDMMSRLPGYPLLIAPHDKRSLVWDVAADCRTRQDARELAARFIPDSHDQMWSNAAREIFVACLVYLQATKKQDWTWKDLHSVVTLDVSSLTELASLYHPDALRNLSPPDSRTTQSTLATFQAHMSVVAVFAEAWSYEDRERFSIRQWLHNPPSFRPLILQHDPAYPDLSRIWVGSMVSFLASAVGSPSLYESKERRIWLFLDEFPQLHPIRHFSSLIELGRSKGVIAVLGVQDLAQLRATYGREQAGAWPGMIGTKVITRINLSESAREASLLIGEQEVERSVKQVSRSRGNVSTTTSVQKERRPVITASEIADDLGPQKKGVRVLFMGIGRDVYEIDLPYISLPELRPGTVPAEWTYKGPERFKAANDNLRPMLTPEQLEQFYGLHQPPRPINGTEEEGRYCNGHDDDDDDEEQD